MAILEDGTGVGVGDSVLFRECMATLQGTLDADRRKPLTGTQSKVLCAPGSVASQDW